MCLSESEGRLCLENKLISVLVRGRLVWFVLFNVAVCHFLSKCECLFWGICHSICHVCVCVPCERHCVKESRAKNTPRINNSSDSYATNHFLIYALYDKVWYNSRAYWSYGPVLHSQFMLKNWPHKLPSQQPHTVSQAWPLTPGSISAAVSVVYPWGSRSLVSVHPRSSGQDLSVIHIMVLVPFYAYY